MRVELRAPLDEALEAALARETGRLGRRRSAGALTPTAVEKDKSPLILWLRLEPFDPGAVRLDHLAAGLDHAGSAFGLGLSGLLAGAAAARLKPLHAERLAHGDLAPRQILVGRGGGVALLAPGLPVVRGLLVAPDQRVHRLRRRAPEVLLGAAPTPTSDVFGLGALLYELLSGRTYRDGARPEALRSAARAGLPPELSGANVPGAVRALLAACLSPDPADRPADAARFIAELERALTASGTALAIRGKLAALCSDYVASDAPRGPEALVAPDPSPLGGSSAGAPFATGADAPPAPTDARSAWAAVLGEPADIALGDPAPATDAETSAAAGGLGSPVALPPSSALGLEASASARSLRLPPALELSPAEEPVAPPAPLFPLGASRGPVPGAPIGALEAQVGPRTKPLTLDEAARLSPRAVLTAALALAGVLGLAVGIAVLRSSGPGDSETDVPPTAEVGTVPGVRSPADRARSPADRVGSPADRVGSKAPSPVAPRRPPEPRAAPPAPTSPAADAPAAGMLTIMSNPSGATVLIDGGYVGKTPLVRRERLDDGKTYEVSLALDGYGPWSRRLRPSRGSLNVVATLPPK